jgi:membrane complex biogenesis BtpA family protein
MVHLLPLPGAPDFSGNISEIYDLAETEARILATAGVDGLIIENFGDEPYLIGEAAPEQLALIAAITYQVRRQTGVPIGVNVQFNAWQAEMAIAYGSMADFVRAEVFVDTVISAQGMVSPCSAQITRYRRQLGASNVLIFADIQTKYTTNLLPQALAQSAQDAVSAGADALIVTGAATGQATPLDAVADVKQHVNCPVLVGSGTTLENLEKVLATADGAIVRSALKEGGLAQNMVSERRATAFMEKAAVFR